MADNVAFQSTTLATPASGEIVAADEIGGAKYQRVKVIIGKDGTNDGDVSAANPIPTAAKLVDESGTAYGVKHIGNKPRVSAMPYLYDIAEGNVSDHVPFLKLGYNADVGVTAEIISAQGGAYVFPAAEQHMHLVSDSVEDDILTGGAVAGTGIHKVTVYYLDDTFAEKTEIVTLNGTTAVETTATDIYRINYVNAEEVGTGKKAAGNISIKNHAETVTYGYIPAGHNRMRQMVYTVPYGKTLYVTQMHNSTVTAAGKACTITLEATYDELHNHILSGFFMPFAEITGESGAQPIDFHCPLRFPAGVDVKVIGFANASTIANVALRGWIE